MSREKQIEEMAKTMVDSDNKEVADALSMLFVRLAEALYNAGYRKQVDDASSATTNNEGKWEKRVFIIFDSEKVGYKCSECNTTWDTPTHYCPNCGTRTKGGAE